MIIFKVRYLLFLVAFLFSLQAYSASTQMNLKQEITQCKKTFSFNQKLFLKCQNKTIKKYRQQHAQKIKEGTRQIHKNKAYKKGIKNQREHYEKVFGRSN